MMFQKAEKQKSKLRLSLSGPSGSGKTYTALALASFLGKKIAVIDSEGGSSQKYADIFSFDYLPLNDCNPDNYIAAIMDAVKEGYDVIVIDSLSHAWNGKNGILELVEKEKLRMTTTNQFQAWGKVSQIQTRLTDALIKAQAHIIATMRVKTEYVVENENGKNKPRKIGLAPIQKEGMEYEFDIVADITPENTFVVTKTRCPALNGYIQPKAGKETADILLAWLNDGVDTPPQQEQPQSAGKSPEKENPAPQEPTPAGTTQAKSTKVSFKTKAKEEPKKETPASEGVPPAKGIFHQRGILEKIAERKEEKGMVYGFILKGEKVGYKSFSAEMLKKGTPLIGKMVECSVLAGVNGLNLLSLELAK